MFLIVRYAKYLICIYMIIYENMRNSGVIPTKYPVSQLLIKLQVKNWYKLMLRHCPFTLWFNMQITLFSYPSMSMKTLEIRENSKENYGGIHTKLIISQLPISLDYQTRYQTDTKIHSFYPVVQHANNLP